MSQYARPYDVSGGAYVVGGTYIIGGVRYTADQRGNLIRQLETQVGLLREPKARRKVLNKLHYHYEQPLIADEVKALRRQAKSEARGAHPDFYYGRKASARRPALPGRLPRLPRPPSAYNEFVRDNMPRVRAMLGPNAPKGEAMRQLGAMWRAQRAPLPSDGF